MKVNKLLILLALSAPLLAIGASPARRDLQAATAAPSPTWSMARRCSPSACPATATRAVAGKMASTPRIAGQHYSVLLKQLVDFRHGKRWDFRMEERADQHHLPSRRRTSRTLRPT